MKYFIHNSFGTYLVGHQQKGESSYKVSVYASKRVANDVGKAFARAGYKKLSYCNTLTEIDKLKRFSEDTIE